MILSRLLAGPPLATALEPRGDCCRSRLTYLLETHEHRIYYRLSFKGCGPAETALELA